jgi:hypothetical protein
MRIPDRAWCTAAAASLLLAGCSNTHLIFTTYTKTGLDISLSNEIPTEVVFGYKRFEGTIVPVDASVEQLRRRVEALAEGAAKASEQAKKETDPHKKAAAEAIASEMKQQGEAARASLQLLESAFALVETSRLSLASAQDGVTTALSDSEGAESTAVVDARARLADAGKQFQDAQKALDRAYEAVSDMTPVLAANRIENSWARGLVICQVFATGDATDALLASTDLPLEELAACTGRGAQ